MEDDITFGTSVWATSGPIAADNNPTPNNTNFLIGNPTIVQPQSTFDDDFSDFGTSTKAQVLSNEDEDFGDFGDFGEVVEIDNSPLAEVDDFRIAGPSSQGWRPLSVNPFPPQSVLESTINETLSPIWNHEDIADVTTDDPIREAEGIAQVLITPSRFVQSLYISPLSTHFS